VPGLEIVAAAGLSLGEFTAHSAAGTFDFATGLNLVFQRGSFMEQACEQTKVHDGRHDRWHRGSRSRGTRPSL